MNLCSAMFLLGGGDGRMVQDAESDRGAGGWTEGRHWPEEQRGE